MFRISYNWLREYVDFDLTPQELGSRLSMVGLETSVIDSISWDPDGVVVGEVVSVESNLRLTKLVLCQVDIGAGREWVVCRARNIKVGDKVPVALYETPIPQEVKEGFPIQVPLRGALCSGLELGVLSSSGNGVFILPKDSPLGERIGRVLGLSDSILGIEASVNRPDCLSVVGVAREVAALVGSSLRVPVPEADGEGKHISHLVSVTIDDFDLCLRYAARVVREVNVAPSPFWLAHRLEASGIKPASNVVDAASYVMIELGQPLNVLDYSKIQGKSIIVRRAQRGEAITTADRVRRELDGEALIVADAQRPVALAGIAWEADAEITEGTVDVMVESANFNPACVRRTARKYGLRTESSYRFELGVDAGGILRALNRAAGLISHLAGGKVAKGTIDNYAGRPRPREVELTPGMVSRIMGVSLSASEIDRLLTNLEFGVERSRNRLRVTVPSFRVDVKTGVDLVEEVARFYGYDRIAESLPPPSLPQEEDYSAVWAERRIYQVLLSSGFSEVLNHSFQVGDQGIKLINPLNPRQKSVRSSLIGGLLETAARNMAAGNRCLRIFEIGRVLDKADGGVPSERKLVAGIMIGDRRGREAVDFRDVKGVVESILGALGIEGGYGLLKSAGHKLHPGLYFQIVLGKEGLGALGQLHPDLKDRHGLSKKIYFFELDTEKLLKNASVI